MPKISDSYYKGELERAAELITGKLVLWIALHDPEYKKYEMLRVTTERIVAAAEGGLSPIVYGAYPSLDLSSLSDEEFNDLVDEAQGIVWLGDIGRDGDVVCGVLLESIIESERSKDVAGKGRHVCSGGLPGAMYGGALDNCSEDEEGRLWVDNGEYCNQVNYCPYCGFRAPVQVEHR